MYESATITNAFGLFVFFRFFLFFFFFLFLRKKRRRKWNRIHLITLLLFVVCFRQMITNVSVYVATTAHSVYTMHYVNNFNWIRFLVLLLMSFRYFCVDYFYYFWIEANRSPAHIVHLNFRIFLGYVRSSVHILRIKWTQIQNMHCVDVLLYNSLLPFARIFRATKTVDSIWQRKHCIRL